MEQNVIQILKRTLIVLFIYLFLINTIHAQSKYFILEEDPKGYSSYNYVLKTDELYGVNDSISVYNLVFFDKVKDVWGNEINISGEDLDIILFSVLPNLDGSNWEEITYQDMEGAIVDFNQLRRIYNEHTFRYYDKSYGDIIKYWNDYKIVIKKHGKLFTAKNVLLEFYAVRNRPEVFNNLIGTINIDQPIHTIRAVQKIYESTFKGTEFPLFTFREISSLRKFDRLRDRKEFLSNKYLIKGQEAYQFWTYTDWHEDYRLYEYNRGIDRFVYMPDKGIIGGSYDFYFFMHRKKLKLTVADFITNIQEEKVMIADNI